MSVATKEVTKCSKRKGEYCRLHNPAPSMSMVTVDDVFKKVAQTSKARKNFTPPVLKNNYNFQPVTEPRILPAGIPMLVKEHEELSLQGLSHLTDEEKLALKGYTGFAAAVCNNVLQGKGYEYYQEAPLWKESTGPCDFVNQEDLVSYFETIDKVLEKRHPERRTIYRGIPIYDSLHDEIGASIGKKLHVKDTDGLVEGLKEYYKPGKVFNNKTYWSSTSSAYVAAERSGNTVGTKQNYWEKADISGIVLSFTLTLV